MYRYGIIWRDNTRLAAMHNDALLGEMSFAVEVTDIVYRARCELGFIDHQRRGGKEITTAEVALDYPLPPKGAILVIERPDKDSFVAIAEFELRAEGMGDEIDRFLITSVGGLDRLGSLKKFREEYPELIEMFKDGLEIQALNVISREFGRIDTPARIEDTKRIITGRATRKELKQIVSFRKPMVPLHDFPVEVYGDIAFVPAPGEYDMARNWADEKGFPIAIISDPGYNKNVSHPHQRYTTICQKERFDRDGFEIAINNKEAEKRRISLECLAHEHSIWGGHGRIVSSPLGFGRETILSKIEILQTAHACVL